ncbi:MAG TPA: hypothetical protein VIP11_23540, partial [Gemmatimonadaceae bacterium]
MSPIITSRDEITLRRLGSGVQVEQDGREGTAGAVSRSQNVVYALPYDWASISQFVAPVLQRVDESATGLQALIVTSSEELAAATAAAAVKIIGDRKISIVGATSARRAARLLR